MGWTDPGKLRLPRGPLFGLLTPAFLAFPLFGLATLGVGCAPRYSTMAPIMERVPESTYTVGGQADDAAYLALLERLVLAARHLGYPVAPYQPTRGRFGVPLRFSMDGERYRIAVELLRERGRVYLRISPIGARVGRVRVGNAVHHEMPTLLMMEIEDLYESFRVASRPGWAASARAPAPKP